MASPFRPRDVLALSPASVAGLPGAALRGARASVRDALQSAFEDPAFRAAWAACVSVPGWLDREAARLLFGLAAHGARNGRVVEIGSYLGRSTILLALASGERVVAVDPHAGELVAGDTAVPADTFPLFVRNVESAGVAERVDARRQTSLEAAESWSEPIRLLYLDGLHHYEAVRDDIAAWAPHVVPDGFVVFDDYAVGDVQRAIGEAQRSGLLRPGVVTMGEAAVVGVRSARELRRYLFPRLR